jgi:hypothetical protein
VAIRHGADLRPAIGIFGPFWYDWVQTEHADTRVINWGNVFQALLGVILLGYGITHFWTRSRFYRS